jgi:outer membrane biosynthesis protein TonB
MAELFDTAEVDRVPRWPLLSRLVALSVVLHGLFMVAVVYVPTLRGLLYVASNVTGIKFVSADYDPTLIGQRATIVRLEPHERLYYPPDYFGAPEVAETTQLDAVVVEQPPPPPAPVYRPRRQRTPRVVGTPEPSPTPEVAQATPSPTPEMTEEQKQAEAEMAKELGVEMVPIVNTKPFVDIAVKGKELVDQGKLDLKNAAIEVTATAERNDDGTLKAETVRLNWVTASDETTSLLAQHLIMALSQSEVLRVLKGAKDVRLALKLDQQTVSVKVASDLPSEDEASKAALGYGTLVGFGRMKKKGTDEGELYNNLKFSNEGRQFTMSFEMPKDAAGKMITEMLAKKANQPAQPPPSAAATPQARSL